MSISASTARRIGSGNVGQQVLRRRPGVACLSPAYEHRNRLNTRVFHPAVRRLYGFYYRQKLHELFGHPF
jgi:hypothetical protein